MLQHTWYTLGEVDDELLKFAVILARYQGKYIIIKNAVRGGWEIPGGRREAGEEILQTACRELYEESGAVAFRIAPVGAYAYNNSFGMVYAAEVSVMADLPAYEIEAVAWAERLPKALNFGSLFYDIEKKVHDAYQTLLWKEIDMR